VLQSINQSNKQTNKQILNPISSLQGKGAHRPSPRGPGHRPGEIRQPSGANVQRLGYKVKRLGLGMDTARAVFGDLTTQRSAQIRSAGRNRWTIFGRV